MNPLIRIKESLEKKENYVVQGGAGSGKTESLKKTIHYILKNHPDKKINCITHTNAAVYEIKDRVGDHPNIIISTIHSFIHSTIKNYKKNIADVMKDIYSIEKMEPTEKNHKEYKNIYSKYQMKLYRFKEESIQKVISKRDYDKKPEEHNQLLNTKIDEINELIKKHIKSIDYHTIDYNDSPFDRVQTLSYGHDTLLKIAVQMFQNYPLLIKIMRDKFDFLLVDEYQDTEREIMSEFINNIVGEHGVSPTMGIYGDAMQSIYDEGIGDVRKYIEEEKLVEIKTTDNYRCSRQVINLINGIRNDGIEQEVALKETNGEREKELEREGSVKLYYDFIHHEKKSNEYDDHLQSLIKKVILNKEGYKILTLTNKAISKKAGFDGLFESFNGVYSNSPEHIERDLDSIQIFELIKVINAYEEGNHNFILTKLKKEGLGVKSIRDKKEIQEKLKEIITYRNKSIKEALRKAIDLGLLKENERFIQYFNRKNVFLQNISASEEYKKLKDLYEKEGITTFNKLRKRLEEGGGKSSASKSLDHICEMEYLDFERNLKRELMYEKLFSEKLKFKEAENYYNYLEEKTRYITMHKTKGTGIENVVVILDNYKWTQYDFNFPPIDSQKGSYLNAEKIFYVACSRTIKNLICVKLIKDIDELNYLKEKFINCERVVLINS